MWDKALLITALFLVGCSKKEIEVYTIPKEVSVTFQTTASAAHWVAPSGWKAQPASSMRLASFEIPVSSGHCELSIVSLSGQAGGVLANINRWRGQLQLSPITESNLGSSVTHKKLKNGLFTLVNLVDSEGKKRILAAILESKENTYFFKVTGSPAQIESVKAAFEAFLATVALSE